MLNRIDIEGLYGLYNYSLDFTNGKEKSLRIITGPNGYGKTTILQLVYALFVKDTEPFYRIPFSSVSFSLDDYVIRVIQTMNRICQAKK